MKIFGSEVHDTSIVFIVVVIVECFVAGVMMGNQPDETFSKFIVFIAALAAYSYWFFTYSSKHFKK